jgi:hypothetical protein
VGLKVSAVADCRVCGGSCLAMPVIVAAMLASDAAAGEMRRVDVSVPTSRLRSIFRPAGGRRDARLPAPKLRHTRLKLHPRQ